MFKETIKELRLQNDMSQEDLAEVLNVTRQSISKYENGTAEPSLDKLAILVDYFDVTYDYLLAGKEETTKPETLINKEESQKAKLVTSTQSTSDFKPVEKTERIKPRIHSREVPAIEVRSKIDSTVIEKYYKFEVVEKFLYIDYKPDALLVGQTDKSFFKSRRVELAWYKTMDDAHKEKEALEAAIAAGNKAYELQYDVPVKRRGFFSVQIDD